MVTGASTAYLAIVLVDARKGLTKQSRRHAFLHRHESAAMITQAS